MDPDIILLDEPFSALDFQTRLLLQGDLWNLIESEKKTVILITHDISEAITLSDRVVMLTRRPATVRTEVMVGLARKYGSPVAARASKSFNSYFEQIWNDLDIDARR